MSIVIQVKNAKKSRAFYSDFYIYFLSTSPPVSPSPSKERGKKKKEGLPPLLDCLEYLTQLVICIKN
jgi:hypothetical protein